MEDDEQGHPLINYPNNIAVILQASVLIFGSTEKPTIRFLLAAMRFSSFARFGYVHLGEPTAEVSQLNFRVGNQKITSGCCFQITAMKEALSIKCSQCENILIFNEQPEVCLLDAVDEDIHLQISILTISEGTNCSTQHQQCEAAHERGHRHVHSGEHAPVSAQGEKIAFF